MNAKFVFGLFAIMLVVAALPNGLRGEDHPPTRVKMVDPTYPHELSNSGISGSVIVEFIIDKNGNVPQAQAQRSSDGRFEAAAVRAVLQWKFKPGEKDGRKVNVRASQLIEFNLDPVPVYPKSLFIERVEGTATIGYRIDVHGRAVQSSVISATRPELGYAAQAAVEATSFAPPLDDATARTPRQITLKFAVNGKSNVPEDKWILSHLNQLRKDDGFPSANTLSKPLVRKSRTDPVYPRGISSDVTTGKAVVEFIVDRQGKVHLPRIVSSSREEFGFSAAQAVGNWTYAPLHSEIKDDGVLVTETLEFRNEN